MIINKDQYQKTHKLTDAEIARLEKCCEGHTFQGLDEFLSTHPELPNNKFVITEVGSITTTDLIVQTNGLNSVIFPVKAFSFKGSWDKGTLECELLLIFRSIASIYNQILDCSLSVFDLENLNT